MHLSFIQHSYEIKLLNVLTSIFMLNSQCHGMSIETSGCWLIKWEGLSRFAELHNNILAEQWSGQKFNWLSSRPSRMIQTGPGTSWIKGWLVVSSLAVWMFRQQKSSQDGPTANNSNLLVQHWYSWPCQTGSADTARSVSISHHR